MSRPYSNEDHSRLAQIWRDAWASANPHIADVAPLDHWLSRIHNEFAPPNLTLVQGGGVAETISQLRRIRNQRQDMD